MVAGRHREKAHIALQEEQAIIPNLTVFHTGEVDITATQANAWRKSVPLLIICPWS